MFTLPQFLKEYSDPFYLAHLSTGVSYLFVFRLLLFGSGPVQCLMPDIMKYLYLLHKNIVSYTFFPINSSAVQIHLYKFTFQPKLSSNAHVSQHKFCAIKPAASLARTHAGEKQAPNRFRIIEERIVMNNIDSTDSH